MVPRNARAYLPICIALFSLITLSALAICSPLVSAAKSASAAPERYVLIGAVLAVSPSNLTNCSQCMVTVTNESPNRSLTWSAISRGIAGVTINPARGTLQPRGQVSVIITMPSNISCPANDTIIFTGPVNSVQVSWSCTPTPTPSPTPTPVTPTPTTATTPSPTPTTAMTPSPALSASPTQTGSSLTPTTTPVPNGSGQQDNGNPPSSSSSVPSILLSVAALLLALLAFTLYLIPATKDSFRNRLLSLILPVSRMRRLDRRLKQNH